MMKAGKALHKRQAEIRIQFHHAPGNLYKKQLGATSDMNSTELVIRIQPDESIYLRVNSKIPGLGMRLDQTDLDLQYKTKFGSGDLPDAYERLILDVVQGDKRLFIRNDELEAAWKLFTLSWIRSTKTRCRRSCTRMAAADRSARTTSRLGTTCVGETPIANRLSASAHFFSGLFG